MIVTERLQLRRFTSDDVGPLATILLHPDVARWLAPARGSVDDVERTLERYERHWDERGYGRFAVCDRASGQLVGRAGVMHEPRWKAGAAKDELGWAIDRDRWGEGLATEAAHASLDDAFGRVGLDEVIAFTVPANVASLRVMEKLGLEHRGSTRWKGLEHVWFAGPSARD